MSRELAPIIPFNLNNQLHLRQVRPEGRHRRERAQLLGESIFGQEEAVDVAAHMMTRAESGVKIPHHPLGTALFMGATGTGKTELGKRMGRALSPHGGDERTKLVDCNEYQHGHNIARLVGAPPGYVGREAPPAIDNTWLSQGPSVVVFDEIEKAHPDLHHLLLGIMAEGTLTGMNEQEMDFRQAFIILTSNIGAQSITETLHPTRRLGFQTPAAHANRERDMKASALRELTETFAHMPEFLGRIDEVVVFNPLEAEHYGQIIQKFVHESNQANRGVLPFISLTDAAANQIISAGGVSRGGARDLRTMFDRAVTSNMADLQLEKQFGRAHMVLVDFDGESLTFHVDL